jgi:hypothetical protein
MLFLIDRGMTMAKGIDYNTEITINLEKASTEELNTIKNAIVKKLAMDALLASDQSALYNEHGSYHRNNSVALKEKGPQG